MPISKILERSITDGAVTSAKIATSAKFTWDTTVKTSGFTASANTGYFCNTTSAAFTVTLPASPTAGDSIQLVDYAGTFDTNSLTINPNGNKIEGSTVNQQLTGDREGATLVYIDSTQGWLATSGINEGTDALTPSPYSIDFLVIAGGGAGALYGGGGAGGYRTSTQTVNGGTVITVTVGDGATGISSVDNVTGASGSNSSISGSGLTTITSAGGGGGGGNAGNGGNGGSGGGGTYSGSVAGTGNTPSTSPSQGNNGGTGAGSGNYGGGGGGGAGAVGGNGTSTTGGNGGNGTASSITGSSVTRAGGGGGSTAFGGTAGTGGSGGGGNGGVGGTNGNGGNGTVNTGSGGGAASYQTSSGTGGNGGKGVVILSMPLGNFSGTTTGSPTESTSGSNKILVFNGSGSYTA